MGINVGAIDVSYKMWQVEVDAITMNTGHRNGTENVPKWHIDAGTSWTLMCWKVGCLPDCLLYTSDAADD